MIGWIHRFWEKHYDIILYLVFGVLTTAVNWAVYYGFFYGADWSATAAKSLAWLIAVLFAFVTNKPFVYRSVNWSVKVVIPELVKFVGCRLGSGILEIAFIFLFVDVWKFDASIMNIIVSVFVVVINYVGGKLLFNNKK